MASSVNISNLVRDVPEGAKVAEMELDPVTDAIEDLRKAFQTSECCYADVLRELNTNLVSPDSSAVTETGTSTTTDDDGTVTSTTTYSDGSSNTTVTDPEGNVTTSSTPGNASGNALGPNCEQIISDVETGCKPCVPGVARREYFVPLASDFNNQVFCIPGMPYAFAWSGIKPPDEDVLQFIADTPDVDLTDATNQYVAVVDGQPYSCDVIPVSDANDAWFCYPGVFQYAQITEVAEDVVDDPNAPDTTVFFQNGQPLLCNIEDTLHGLQIEQFRLYGVVSPILEICPECMADGSDIGDGSLPLFDVDCPDIDGLTSGQAYYKMWLDWWKCEKKSKQTRQWIDTFQLVPAIWGLVESIQTYNKVLDKNLEILCDVRDDVSDVRDLSIEILGTEDAPGLLQECQTSFLAGHADRLGIINNSGKAFCDSAEDAFECYRDLWNPIEKEYARPLADRLLSMIDQGDISSTDLQNWADSLRNCITDNMLPEVARQFAPLMSSVGCVSTNLNQWREDLKNKSERLSGHYFNTYQRSEARMIPPVMDMSRCLVERVCQFRDELYDASRCNLNTYREYQNAEVPQALAGMVTAAEIIPRLVESAHWLDTNIPAALQIFDCFQKESTELLQLTSNNAERLAPEVVRCFEWFSENAQVDRNFFDNCYRDQECRLVKRQLDFACGLVCKVSDNLDMISNWSTCDRNFYDENFRDIEKYTSQAVVRNAHEASNDQRDFRKWWTKRTEEFQNIWETNWMPCDVDNLKYHCDVWNHVNPLLKIHTSAEEMQELSRTLQSTSQTGVLAAQEYAQEIFQGDQERFSFDLTDPAVLHVRKQIDAALQDLTKGTSQFCKGSLLDATVRLKTEGARAEGAAHAQASRWKWWANEQLDNKGHDRKLQMIDVLNNYTALSMEASKLTTANYDQLLGHMREAIIRGQTYTGNMQDAGRNTISIMGNEMDAMIRMIQLWHFWPEFAMSSQGAFQQASQSAMQDAQSLVQLGHFWPDFAHREKTTALTASENAVGVGVQMTQLGQFYLEQAIRMNSLRTDNASQAAQIGNAFANTGHNLQQISDSEMNSALSQSIAGGQLGIAAGQLGAQHMATALEMENRMTLNALEHLKAGIGGFGVALDFSREFRQSSDSSGAYSANAMGNLINLFKHGQNHNLMAMTANEYCTQTQMEMLFKAKDYLQRNFQLSQSTLHGGTSGTLSAGNTLLNQQGQNAAGAFGLLGNSLESLTSNSSLPPFPTGGNVVGGGNGAFGLFGGGFN